MDLPAVFGRYRVKKKLGDGGMGAVYLVENTELEREEALKVPHFDLSGDPEVRERFLREAKSAAKVDHPNLCPVYDVGVQDGIYFLTMRYLKGKPLSDYAGKPQPARKTVEIVTKLAQALEAAHVRGIIHRDLKPNNVILCPGTGPTVMDFGLAKQSQQQGINLTRMGTVMGTPAYMPPEQVKGELDKMGPASDVYSLGVILYELLTGRLPFEGEMAEMFGKILYTEAPLPSRLQPGLNPALDAICQKALAKDVKARYSSMKALIADLANYLRTTPVTEGAGHLVPTVGGPADVFQAATVAPAQPAPSTASPRGQAHTTPTQVPAEPAPKPLSIPVVQVSQLPAPVEAPAAPASAAPTTRPAATSRSSTTRPAPVKASPPPLPRSGWPLGWIILAALVLLVGGLLVGGYFAWRGPAEAPKGQKQDWWGPTK